MKSFDRFFAAVIFALAAVFAVCNLFLINVRDDGGRQYRVEASRIEYEIRRNGIESVDLSEYDGITAVTEKNGENADEFFDTESDYIIKDIDGTLYRIEYVRQSRSLNKYALLILNVSLAAVSLITIGVMFFIRQKILKPFEEMREVPYELSRGNLIVPLKENRDRFFGRFVWGIDLLRENLEQSKQRELDLQREKKTLLLSLSHDIKTPLSAIKLYSGALTRELYSDRKKQIEIAGKINEKADEIEGFVSEIIKASSGDFLKLEVDIGEFYLSEVMNRVKEYYNEKLALVGVDFKVAEYPDCILKGDPDRLAEVIQNIIENAVKYGDGHEITVEISEEEDCRLIAVKNSGCTLADTELPHIFDSFWRGSNVGSNAGSGLGLYICRQLMHKMDGEIFADISGNYMCVTAVVRKAT